MATKVYYSQIDPRWKNHPYPSPSLPNATIGSGGCGATCAAMVISSTKETIYPSTMGDIARANGYRVNGGTADGLFTYICQRWGLEIERIHSSYEALERCKNGYFVVMVAGKGLWTDGGHFILAVGAEGDKIEIFDPYLYNGKFNRTGRAGKVELRGNSAFVQIDTFKASSNIQRLYAIKVDGNTPTPTPPSSKTMYVNTNYANLNVRSGAGTNYSIIGSLPKGTQVTVYEESNGFSRIGGGQWVSSSYLSSTKPSSGSTTKTAYVKVNSSLNVRAGAGIGYRIVGSLSNGTRVTIYEESNGWARIGNGQWVSSQYLSGSSSVSYPTKTVRVNSVLNVRAGAGTNYRVIRTLKNGTKVTVYATNGGWSRIGNGEWVSSQYLK